MLTYIHLGALPIVMIFGALLILFRTRNNKFDSVRGVLKNKNQNQKTLEMTEMNAKLNNKKDIENNTQQIKQENADDEEFVE